MYHELFPEHALNLCLLRRWTYFHQWQRPLPHKIIANSRLRPEPYGRNTWQVSRPHSVPRPQRHRLSPANTPGCAGGGGGYAPVASAFLTSFNTRSYAISMFTFHSPDLCRCHWNSLLATEGLWHGPRSGRFRAGSGASLGLSPAPPRDGCVTLGKRFASLCFRLLTCNTGQPLSPRSRGIKSTMPGTR